jgi:hypothetical protein
MVSEVSVLGCLALLLWPVARQCIMLEQTASLHGNWELNEMGDQGHDISFKGMPSMT